MDKIRRRPVRDRSAKGSSLAQITSAMTTLTAACALLISGLSLKVTRDGQMTSRFSSAIEQLGSQNLDTKVGAIYALSRLAVDSKDDRSTVVDLLTDYVRARIGPRAIRAGECRSAPATAMDVVAALRALFFRLTYDLRKVQVDLRGVCITGVRFSGADLSCMLLDNAVMDGSVFDDAKLTGASLQHAQFANNSFERADFSRADASGATFGDDSDLPSAFLTGAVLRETDLTAAVLIGVDLSGADLDRTVLTDADLRLSDLTGARVRTWLGEARNRPLLSEHPGAPTGPVAFPGRGCSG